MCTFSLAEEYGFASELGVCRFCGVEPAEQVQLRSRREVEKCLEFSLKVDLTCSFEDVYTLFGGDNGVAIEISSPLLKFSEVLN